MPLVVSITMEDVYTKLRTLVLDVVPAGVVCIKGLPNRAAMPPPVPGFVTMTATTNKPLRTPVDTWDRVAANPSTISIEQGMGVRIQLDCYGAASADWAVMLATIMRNDYGCRLLAPMAPLYADDPIQAALVNGEEQYERRWIVGAHLQYNPVISTPMQFADTAQATLINIDERFPP